MSKKLTHIRTVTYLASEIKVKVKNILFSVAADLMKHLLLFHFYLIDEHFEFYLLNS